MAGTLPVSSSMSSGLTFPSRIHAAHWQRRLRRQGLHDHDTAHAVADDVDLVPTGLIADRLERAGQIALQVGLQRVVGILAVRAAPIQHEGVKAPVDEHLDDAAALVEVENVGLPDEAEERHHRRA